MPKSIQAKPSRRTLVGGAAAAIGTLAVPKLLGAQTASSRRPNIVFIMADDLGYADLACYGRRDIATPHLDRLASQGSRMLQAYANSPVCSATRTALITGRYQYRLPVGLEEPIPYKRDIGLPPSHPTLPSRLRNAGYSTALVGKWHLGKLPHYGPLKSGYERFFGFRTGAIDYFTHRDSGGNPDLWEGDDAVEQAGYMTDLIGDRAASEIGRLAGDPPFFLSVHFSAPHWPWEGPGDEAEAAKIKRLTHYDGGTLDIYRQMVERMDHQVGRILQALDAASATDDTIVIFTSDNGGERFSDTYPFTGRKEELLEGGLRVPAIVRWPGHIPAGTNTAMAITMDWMPTLLSAAGATADPAFPSDGIDLLPQLIGTAQPRERIFHWRYKGNRQRACREGDWKILKILDNSFLFNVADDPMERANLKTRHPDIYRALAAKWDAWNRTMLPQIAASYTENHVGAEWADHIGARPTSWDPDPGAPWPDPVGGEDR
jgi:arylsulfatase A-like enzyme